MSDFFWGKQEDKERFLFPKVRKYYVKNKFISRQVPVKLAFYPFILKGCSSVIRVCFFLV